MTGSKSILFEKIVAAGNDFVVIDHRKNALGGHLKQTAIQLCDRKRGIGADGLLLLEESKKADIRMRIYNSDGSEAEMCGNGVRCLSEFAVRHQIVKNIHTVETVAGIIRVQVQGHAVRAQLTSPKDFKDAFKLNVDGRKELVYFLNTGVPHAVIFEAIRDRRDVVSRGRAIRMHKEFAPKGTNVNFVSQTKDGIRVRTYERGVEDETLACGTGSTASALIASKVMKLRSPIKVTTTGGEVLKIYFSPTEDGFEEVFLEGAVHKTFEGSIHL